MNPLTFGRETMMCLVLVVLVARVTCRGSGKSHQSHKRVLEICQGAIRKWAVAKGHEDSFCISADFRDTSDCVNQMVFDTALSLMCSKESFHTSASQGHDTNTGRSGHESGGVRGLLLALVLATRVAP